MDRGSEMMRPGGPEGQQQADRELPPSFILTVTGTTPRKQAAEFLNDTFLAYLQKRAEQSPASRKQQYRIKEIDLRDVMPKMELAQSQGERQGERRGQGEEGMRDGRMAEGMRGGEMARGMPPEMRGSGSAGRMGPDSMSGEMGMSEMGRSGQSREVDVTHLEPHLPEHPLAEEDRSQDWQFEIGWRVEIVRPGEETEQEDEDAAEDEAADTIADAENPR